MKKIITGIMLILLSIFLFAYLSSNKNFSSYFGFLYIFLGFSGFYLMLGFSEFIDTNRPYTLSHSMANKEVITINKKRFLELLFIIESENGRKIIRKEDLFRKISETYQIYNDKILEYAFKQFFYSINENPKLNFVYLNGLIIPNEFDIHDIIKDYLFEKKLSEGSELKIKGKTLKDQIILYAKQMGFENICIDDKILRYFILEEQDRYIAIDRMSMLCKEAAAMLFLFINNYLVIENATAY